MQFCKTFKRGFLSTLGFLCQVSLLCSCNAKSVKTEADTKYAVFNSNLLQFSPLRSINETGEVNICIALFNYEPEHQTFYKSNYELFMQRVVQTWNKALLNNPSWRQKSDLTVHINTIFNNYCPTDEALIKVHVYNYTEQEYLNEVARYNYKQAKPFAIIQSKQIVLGYWNDSQQLKYYDHYAVLLHEYAHLLGLADTYQISGISETRENVPKSVMNTPFLTDLTLDDVVGIWAVFQFINTGVHNCDGFGRYINLTVNEFNETHCDPRAEPTSLPVLTNPTYKYLADDSSFNPRATPPPYNSFGYISVGTGDIPTNIVK